MAVKKKTLRPSFLKRAVAPLRDELGKTNNDRLDKLIGLFEAAGQERVRLSECLKSLFPGQELDQQLAALRGFRKTLNDAAGQKGLDLDLCVDTKLRNAPEDRWLWFEGPDPTIAEVTNFSASNTADIQAGPLIASRAVATDRAELEGRKRRVTFFLSYAHADQKDKENLMQRVLPLLRASRRYVYTVWHDGDILVGQRWREAIRKALDGCDFGLFLVSSGLLTSEFIGQEELPRFVGPNSSKPVLPVALGQIHFERMDLKGIEEPQVFRHGERCYAQCVRREHRDAFAHALFEAVERRLDDHFHGVLPASPVPKHVPPPARRPDEWLDQQVGADEIPPYGIRGRVRKIDLRQLESKDVAPTAADQGEDAVEALVRWVQAEDEPRFCAVLGEYGIGKTTTLKQFTRTLLERRRTEPETPLPIYVDLRLYVEKSGQREEVPTLREILAGVIERSWKLPQPAGVTPDDLIRLVREEGAVAIFDGLDEKIVHLRTAQAQAFIRELWRILPPFRRGGDGSTSRPGRMILSCRSHYFKDVWSQNAMLTGEDREGVKAADYRAFIILPWNEEQIRDYLGHVVGPERVDPVMDLFRAVHNLRDLAQRPYLLSVLADHLGELEGYRAAGRPVRSVDVYEMLVRRWLGRDAGKHHFIEAHKRLLMEDLAAALAADGSREWPWERLQTWLSDYLRGNERFAYRYRGQDPDVLDEDLRTATFVLRPDLGEARLERFRFAHTSLQEYFLALHLKRALDQGRPHDWALAEVSWETLDFLGELLAGQPTGAPAFATLDRLLEVYVPQATRLAFRYWSRALQKGWREPAPATVDLHGEDLDDWQIAGPSADRPLRLVGANLAGASLARAQVRHVDLSGADLRGASLCQAVLDDVCLRGARAGGADLTGSTWWRCDLTGLSASDANWWDAHGCRSSVEGGELPADFARAAAWVGSPGWAPPGAARPELGAGHRGPVHACVWSPDGARVLSASDDGTLRVWDARSGRTLLELKGHRGWVLGCAWSPDGARVLSASDDRTLRVWDARSGRTLVELTGHRGWVRDCAWSPDGTRVLSAAHDRTLRVWDAQSGRTLLELTGHCDWVRACAWSPDGTRVLSASGDGTLWVWDAQSGRSLVELKGHSGWVLGCAWSPDGARVLSASRDGTLRVWDARSGRTLVELTGHSGWVRGCAWSPDGSRVLSASDDRTLRVWDARSGRTLVELTGHGDWVWGCAWSPDGARVLSASHDGTLRVWDAQSGPSLLKVKGHRGLVEGCAWSPDGTRVLSASDDGTLRVWNAQSGRTLVELTGHGGGVWGCAWSPDEACVLSASDDRTLRVWDAQSGRMLREMKGHSDWVKGCAWSPDGSRVLSASDDGTLRVWDAQSGRTLLELKGHSGMVWGCAWSPDGTRVLSASGDGTLRVWNAQSGRTLVELTGHRGWVRGCAWSPGGARVLSASADQTLRVWDAQSGRTLLELKGHSDWVTSCAWSPDGARVLSASADGTLRMWNAQSGQRLLELKGHRGGVTGCAWSPDGSRLLSASDDGTMRAWDAASGEPLLTWHLFAQGDTCAFDETERRIVAASPGAWRHISYLGWCPLRQALRSYPAESLGPLPIDAPAASK
jgi:WD40 repeat protein/uncharacterized protein YjbI with pentapeptide repeats